MGRGTAREHGVGPARPRGDLLRHEERLDIRLARRGRGMDRGGTPPASRALGRSRRVVTVRLPNLLADQAGGQKEFEVEAGTVRDALERLPIRDLLFDERGELRPLVNVYVDRED